MLAFESHDLASLVRAIKTLPIHLITVTMPHKEIIKKYLDEIRQDASEVGAVNTIVNKGGVLIGYNTDIEGVSAALCDVAIQKKRILLLGAGGAARVAAYVSAKNNGELFIHNRTKKNADILVRAFGGAVISGQKMRNMPFDIIINATPVGMYPNSNRTPLENYRFVPGQVVFDVLYSPVQTRMLREAKRAGARAISGIDMFLAQALSQITIWTGSQIPKNIKQSLKIFLKNQLKNINNRSE